MDTLTQIPTVKQLEPYFKIAEKEAKKSPCVRRQYGALQAYFIEGNFTVFYDVATNQRVSSCCNGNICARDVVKTKHGGNVEIGAEIHAETALMINAGGKAGPLAYCILVGFDHGRELLGSEVYPCHSCAIVLKYSGVKRIYHRDKDNQIVTSSIEEILKYRIAEWEPVD